jgi:predicted transcriptional regulator
MHRIDHGRSVLNIFASSTVIFPRISMPLVRHAACTYRQAGWAVNSIHLEAWRCRAYRQIMALQIQLKPEIEAIVGQIADREGVSPEVLLATLVEEFATEEREEAALVKTRMAAATRGEFLSQTEMDERFRRMLEPR